MAAVVVVGLAAMCIGVPAKVAPVRSVAVLRQASTDHQRPCPRWFAAMVHPVALPIPTESAWLAALAVTVVVAILAVVLGGIGLAVIALVGLVGTAGVGLRLARHRLDQLVQRGVPDSLDAIARSTRSGRSVLQALADLDTPQASPADRCFVAVARSVHRGASLQQALSEVIDSTSIPALRLATTALIVGSQTGAAPARAVEGVAATLRDRLALERELAAQSSQARASVAVLVLAPLGFGLFALATDPRVGQFLLRSPVGWTCLVLGLGLNALGAWWMSRIMADVR